jgi:acyl-CoA synthetase
LGLADVLKHMAALGVSRKKWPEHLVLVEEMAVTATGKLDKKAMAALARSQLNRD